MLRIEGLVKQFGALVAVRNLGFEVNGGEIVGLLGPNGAGKTTSLRCIASILQPSAGRITLCGHDLNTNTLAAKRCLAYVPEVPHPYEMLTVLEHLHFIATAYAVQPDWDYAQDLLQRLDLWEKRDELAASLSKGMRQKLACVCAFFHRPRVFCFDEPLIGLDPRGARELKNLLAERRDAGDAVLISTHQLDTAERLCDRVIIMHRGEVLIQGTVNDIQGRAALHTDATLEDMFLHLTAESDLAAGTVAAAESRAGSA